MARSFDDPSKDDDKDKKYSEPEGAAARSTTPPPLPGDEAAALPLPLPLPGEQNMAVEEVAEEGRHLYLDFIRTEINRSGLSDNCIDTPDDGSVDPQKVLQWIRAGSELRQLADAFSRSKERDAVRKKASNVPVETLDVDHFMYLLQELFQGGNITRERIVVLFFFCADVAMQALRLGLHRTFHRLLEWSLRYIGTHVASWVHSHGGWGVVLRSGLDVVCQISACCAFLAVVAACVVYIRRQQ